MSELLFDPVRASVEEMRRQADIFNETPRWYFREENGDIILDGRGFPVVVIQNEAPAPPWPSATVERMQMLSVD